MGKRSKSRELALQFLFQHDFARGTGKTSHEKFWNMLNADDHVREFADELIEGTLDELEVIDPVITKATKNWSISRMEPIDRNVLRIAVYELMFRKETPFKVVINEAVELAKKFGTPESKAFVNGVLDKVVKNLSREKKTGENKTDS